ncbi:MAG: homoserine kinase, partial [Alphaproteobacteria bacterium]|nr:homoserine kinase [Alphaproteobacteria bacterium]
MAIYTHVDDEELAAFLSAYDLGTVLSFKGIAEGVENSNYLLRTEKGSYILTLYEKRVDEDDLPFFLGLMRHLAAQGVPCPTPVEGSDGTALHQLCGRPAALISYLDGVSLRHPHPHHCAELGRALAKMHQAGQSFDMQRENALGPEGWQSLAQACTHRADEVKSGLKNLIETEMAEVAADWPMDLPRGVIHADLFPDNVFFLGDELSGLIDFYFACTDLLAYDLAI